MYISVPRNPQNNSRYTVAIEPARSREGERGLLFSHPMPPHEENIDKNFGRPPWYVFLYDSHPPIDSCWISRRLNKPTWSEVEEEAQPKPQHPPAPTAGQAGAFTLREVARHK